MKYTLLALALVSNLVNLDTAAYQTPPNVRVLTCRRCGKLSVSWGWDNLEEQK